MISTTAKQLASLYLENESSDIEGELAKIASNENFNAQTIERIVNRTNRNIIVGLQKEAVQGDHDPHFTFPTMKTANVLAVLRSAKPSAMPSAPEAPARPGLPSLGMPASRASEVNMLDYVGKEPKDKGIAMSILSMLKLRLAEKKSNLARIEIAIEEMIRNFEKCAANELLRGTPVEVFESLPVTDIVSGVQEKLAGWGHKFNHLEDPFELDSDHPLVKMAGNIHSLRETIDSAAAEIAEVNSEISKARESLHACDK